VMHTSASHVARLTVLVLLSVLFTGCASLFTPDCARFEEDRKQTDYTPRFDRSTAKTRKLAAEMRPLSRNVLAAAPVYRIEPETGPARRCTHFTLRKELYLQRSDRVRALIVEETREIFTEGGKRVATKVVNLSEQLAKPGYYSAQELLPIPEATPAGKYRVVSRLTYRTKPKAKPALMARATLDFEVPPKKTR
jgi:hypothetical protein